ncbi:MAG: hypothetical protein WBF33_25305 [Candidatus Nitrosopolaris sp.]|jgi:hypothetical protein
MRYTSLHLYLHIHTHFFIFQMMSFYIQGTFYKKEDVDSKEARNNILALLKAIGDTRQLTGFDNQLIVLRHLVRVTQQIIDEV